MKNMKWTYKTCVVMGVMLLSLTACQGKNPLLSDENLSKLKPDMQDRYFTQHEAGDCANYLAAGANNPSLKATCDKWLKTTYQQLEDNGTLSQSATLEDFSDPKLWEVLKYHPPVLR